MEDPSVHEELMHVEPSFICKKYSIFEKCCICFIKSKNITKSEFENFKLLKRRTVISYDEKNNEHEESLRTLYELHYKKKIETDRMMTPDWKKLGFQVLLLNI